jgi:hypothetical protein
MSRLIPILIALSLLFAGVARASDLDDEALRGIHSGSSMHAVAGDEGKLFDDTDRCNHCCHGCIYPVAVSGSAVVMPFDRTQLTFGVGDTVFHSLTFPPLLQPPSI